MDLLARLGLYGILAQQLGAANNVIIYRDTDMLEKIRKKVDYNIQKRGGGNDVVSSIDLLHFV